jgi:hypothetical protein
MWLGHPFRTDELYPWRRITFTNPEGTRKVGPNPIINMDSSEEGLIRHGVNDWKAKAGNRMDWRSELGAVKHGTCLWYQYDDDGFPTTFYCKILLFVYT